VNEVLRVYFPTRSSANERDDLPGNAGHFDAKARTATFSLVHRQSPRGLSVQIGPRLLALIRVHWRFQLFSHGSGALSAYCL